MHDTFLAAGLFASRRQHSADPRGGAALRADRARPDPRHRDRLRNPDRPRDARSACTSTRSTTSPISARRPAAGIGTLLGLQAGDDLSGRAAGGACQPHHAAVAQGRDQLVEGLCAGAFAGKLAVEAVDRVMRGEGAPSPDLRRRGRRHRLAARTARRRTTTVPLPEPGEAKRAILDTYTKEHSAEYQSQALIDLALRMRAEDRRPRRRSRSIVIHTSHHTHYVIGTGANDPQKMDPKASRETLDHSIMYIFAVALAGRRLASRRSATRRSARAAPTPCALWHKIETLEDPEWTRRYHATIRTRRRSAAASRSCMQDGTGIVDEMAVANAHPLGATTVQAADYIRKFRDADGRRHHHARGEPLPAQAVRRICRRLHGRRTAPTLTLRRSIRPRARCAVRARTFSTGTAHLRPGAARRHDRQGRLTHERHRSLPNRRRKASACPASPPATPRCAPSAAPATTCTIAATTSSTSPRPASSRRSPISSCTAALPTPRRTRRLQGEADVRCAACRAR